MHAWKGGLWALFGRIVRLKMGSMNGYEASRAFRAYSVNEGARLWMSVLLLETFTMKMITASHKDSDCPSYVT
jgi:hypothetical protein